MVMRKLITENTIVESGKTYAVTISAKIFPEEFAKLLNGLKSFASKTLQYMEGKNFTITSIYNIPNTNKIVAEFYVNDNPAPIGVIIAVILALALGFIIFLTVDKIEEIVEESPTIVSLALIAPVIIVIIIFLSLPEIKKLKG